MNPDDALQIATEHSQAGQLFEAEKILRQVLAAQPNHPEALHQLGLLAGRAGQFEWAVELISRAVANDPDHFRAHSNLANFLVQLKRFEEAITAANRSIQINPNYADAFNNLGTAMEKQDRLEQALAAFDRAIAINPRHTAAHNNRGLVFSSMGEPAQAVAAFQKAIELDPNMAMAHNNLAKELRGLRQFDESLAEFQKALQLNPAEHLIHWNFALALLSLGHFAQGWEEFDWGIQSALLITGRQFTAPAWNGQDLRDQTLFLHDEGGYGDAIQFVRYVAPLKTLGASLILQCKPSLVPLFANLPGVDSVIEYGIAPPACDFHSSLQSLPRIFKTDLTNIPNQVPYLKAPAAYLERWRPRLCGDGPKVGLVWSGVSHHEVPKASRIHGHEFLASMAQVRGVQFFSLQKENDSKIPRPGGLPMIDLGDDLHDFANTAAVVEQLDLVITVDTAAAHLAGALARPVWMLIPHHADFHYRWLLDRTDSPWYPTMKIFRQSRPGDVAGTLDRVVAALKEFRP